MDLSHSTQSARVPRILIAEKHGSTVASLIQTCRDRQLNLDVDVCSSHHSAVDKLLASSYQLIISSVHLAEIDDFLLLHRTRALDGVVPVVITAATGEKVSAWQVLEQGAFDFIPTPVKQIQAVSTIRLALWHNKLTALIASQNEALERYRQRITSYPGNRSGEAFRTILTSIEQTVAASERTIHQVKTSIKRFVDLAEAVETQARKRALTRLDRLYGSPRQPDLRLTQRTGFLGAGDASPWIFPKPSRPDRRAT